MSYTITNNEIKGVKIITSSTFFVDASVNIQIQTENQTLEATLSTSQSYHQNDLSLPRNEISVIDGSEILMVLDELFQSDLDQDSVIEEINERRPCGSYFSKKEIQIIYEDLNDAIIEASSIVDAAEKEAEDNSFYVLSLK